MSEEGRPSADAGDTTGQVRENVVQKLLQGYHDQHGPSAIADFMGAEFQHDPPTDAERAEAHRRYVEELAERGVSGLGDPEP